MSDDLFNLEKEVEFVLEKRNLRDVKARVGNALDVSGSTRPLYSRGIMQRYLNRGLALAIKMDDDGVLDTWAFDNGIAPLPPVTRNNFSNYVDQHIITRKDFWGSTQYAPPLREAYSHWFSPPVAKEPPGFFARMFGAKKTEPVVPKDISTPSLLLFWTDGENDPSERSSGMVDRILKEIKGKPLYISFVGVGDYSFTTIRRAADAYDNVGFLHVPQNRIETIPDDELYEALVTEEMAQWLRSATASA